MNDLSNLISKGADEIAIRSGADERNSNDEIEKMCCYKNDNDLYFAKGCNESGLVPDQE